MSGSSQKRTVDTRGVIALGQTVLFRLPRGGIKSAVLKQNSYEVVWMDFRVVELIASGQFHSVKPGHFTRMSLLGIHMGWRMRSWTKNCTSCLPKQYRNWVRSEVKLADSVVTHGF